MAHYKANALYPAEKTPRCWGDSICSECEGVFQCLRSKEGVIYCLKCISTLRPDGELEFVNLT